MFFSKRSDQVKLKEDQLFKKSSVVKLNKSKGTKEVVISTCMRDKYKQGKEARILSLNLELREMKTISLLTLALMLQNTRT